MNEPQGRTRCFLCAEVTDDADRDGWHLFSDGADEDNWLCVSCSATSDPQTVAASPDMPAN